MRALVIMTATLIVACGDDGEATSGGRGGGATSSAATTSATTSMASATLSSSSTAGEAGGGDGIGGGGGGGGDGPMDRLAVCGQHVPDDCSQAARVEGDVDGSMIERPICAGRGDITSDAEDTFATVLETYAPADFTLPELYFVGVGPVDLDSPNDLDVEAAIVGFPGCSPDGEEATYCADADSTYALSATIPEVVAHGLRRLEPCEPFTDGETLSLRAHFNGEGCDIEGTIGGLAITGCSDDLFGAELYGVGLVTQEGGRTLVVDYGDGFDGEPLAVDRVFLIDGQAGVIDVFCVAPGSTLTRLDEETLIEITVAPRGRCDGASGDAGTLAVLEP